MVMSLWPRFFWPTLYMESHKLNSWRWLAAASVAVPIKPVPAMLTAVSVDEEIKLGPVVMDEYIVMSVTVDVVLEAIRLNVF